MKTSSAIIIGRPLRWTCRNIDRDPQACTEALDTLLKDNALRMCMGRAGGRQVEANSTWDRSVHHLERIFEQVVEHHEG